MSRWIDLLASICLADVRGVAIREMGRYILSRGEVRRALTVFAVCAVVALVAMLSGLPAWYESRGIEATLMARYDEAAREHGHAALVRAVKQAMTDVEVVEKKLASPAVQTTLVNQLNGIARRDGVRIVNSSYEEGKGGDGNRVLLHELLAEGDYASLRRFVTDLRTMSTLTIIREASLTMGNANLLTARLRLATYRGANNGR